MANKGGIVISFEYCETKFTFISAHLAAHEGKTYYRHRCNNLQDILRYSKTFDFSKISGLAVASHHIFLCGDLNFRTNFSSNYIDDDTTKMNDTDNTYSMPEGEEKHDVENEFLGLMIIVCTQPSRPATVNT